MYGDAFAIEQMLIKNMVGYLCIYHIFDETNKPKMSDNANDKVNCLPEQYVYILFYFIARRQHNINIVRVLTYTLLQYRYYRYIPI